MASELLEASDPCNNGEAGFLSTAVHDQDEDRNDFAPCSTAIPDDGPVSPSNVEHALNVIPTEEARKGKVAPQTMEAPQEQLPANNFDRPAAIPSPEAVSANDTEPADTASTMGTCETESSSFPPATEVERIVDFCPPDDAELEKSEILSPTKEIPAEEAEAGTVASTEAVICDSSIASESVGAVSKQSVELSVEVTVASPPRNIADYIAVATVDSPVVASVDLISSVDNEITAPVATDSVIVKAALTDLTDSPAVQLPSPRSPGSETPLEEESLDARNPEDELPLEVDAIQVPSHWHSKPCVHISSIGGALTEEELQPLFSTYGNISSVAFENERHDAVLIRFDIEAENADELLAQVREATNSTKLGDKTLIVEPFRPDSLLFVGNLTPGIDDAALQTMFDPHGTIERAFVLYNAEGQSKCYGFVEYSLKSQAMTAKSVMGNINMDGRVLRVEWSDCRRVEDMFSTVLFIDRIPREGSNIEGALNNLFAKYGRIRDSHLAIGTANQMRGFGFIDFYHSRSADQAHQTLDGCSFEGSNIRVSFANPSKSAQSYKFRYGAQTGQVSVGRGGSGGPPPRGLSSRGPAPRSTTPMPLLPSRFMNPARPGMLGFGLGMQFGRAQFDRGTAPSFHGNSRGMLGPNSFGSGRGSYMMGNMAPRAGMAVVDNKLPYGQGSVSITPSAIVQVATAQARAREEEAKARAEAARQGISRSFSGNDSFSMNQYQRLQQMQHQQQQVTSYEQQYKQGDFYMHQQAQQASLQTSQQAWNQQHAQQNMQFQRMPYHSSPNLSQQQHLDQGVQNDAYYQQSSHAHLQQHGYTSQYGQHQGYQYQQGQMYGQVAQQPVDPYQQATTQSQTVYSQPNYTDQYALQQQASQQSYNTTAGYDASAGLDASQQQAYAAYYQQQAQVQAQAQAQASVNPESGTSVAPQTAQQSYEAQWAAYYASQAAYQQQTSSVEAGQKRSADQMEAQNQVAYSYPGYSQQANPALQQQQSQPSSDTAAYQGQTATSVGYQQQAAYAAANYPQQGSGVVGYQQAGAVASYPATGTTQTGYDQSSAPVVESGFQQPAAAFAGQAGVFDYSKRPRF